jgi:hypothetical protein
MELGIALRSRSCSRLMSPQPMAGSCTRTMLGPPAGRMSWSCCGMAAHLTRVLRRSRSLTSRIRWAFVGSVMTDPATEAPVRTVAQPLPPRPLMPAELPIVSALNGSPFWEAPAAVHGLWHVPRCLLIGYLRQPPSRPLRHGQHLASTSSPQCPMGVRGNYMRPRKDALSWSRSLLPMNLIPSRLLLPTTQRWMATGPGSTALCKRQPRTGPTV